MRHAEKIAPVAAVAGLLSSLACCLPLGIAGAAGFAGLAAVLAPLRPWLMGISIVLLAVGLWQLYRSGRTCRRRSPAGIAIFWACALLVLAMIAFPQAIAGFLADRLP